MTETPGPQTITAPPRRPGSVRRTAHVTVTAPPLGAGFLLAQRVDGAGRDVATGIDGHDRPEILDEVSLSAICSADGAIEHVESTPDAGAVRDIVGAAPGFRFRSHPGARGVIDALSGSLLGTVVADLSGSVAPTAYAIGRETRLLSVDVPIGAAIDRGPRADTCAGWATDSVAVRTRESGGPTPLADDPPTAPAVPHTADDPWAWHDIGKVEPVQGRRLRRLDVWHHEDGTVHGDCWFRDSCFGSDEREVVVHEYGLRVVVEPGSWTVHDLAIEARELPFPECPSAVGHARRVVGATLPQLRESGTLARGAEACTHLNDMLRSLVAIESLAAACPPI